MRGILFVDASCTFSTGAELTIAACLIYIFAGMSTMFTQPPMIAEEDNDDHSMALDLNPLSGFVETNIPNTSGSNISKESQQFVAYARNAYFW